MKVLFEHIPDDGLTIDIRDASWFPDDEVERRGAATAGLRLTKGRDRVLADGWLRCELVLACDRCLEEYTAAMESRFRVDIELLEADDPLLRVEEHACSAGEMDVQYVAEPEVDVSHLLRQQVFLAMPVKRLCRADCRGLCPRCGSNLNIEPCSCSGNDPDSPFAVLAALK